MRIYINTVGDSFEVGIDATGMGKVGRGKTLKKALGDFLISHQRELGISHIELDEGALAAEQKRREKELAKR